MFTSFAHMTVHFILEQPIFTESTYHESYESYQNLKIGCRTKTKVEKITIFSKIVKFLLQITPLRDQFSET